MTFTAGDTEELVEVMIINDNVYEGEEQFEAFLDLQSGSSGVALSQQTMATATIQDDDGIACYKLIFVFFIPKYFEYGISM